MNQNQVTEFFSCERDNILYYIILAIVGGGCFYCCFSLGCDYFLPLIVMVLGVVIILYSITIENSYSYIYLIIIFFIGGIFYGKFYIYHNAKNTYYDKKLYIKGQGKVVALKPFYNSANKSFGVNLILTDLEITKLDDFSKSAKIHNKKNQLKKNKKKLNQKAPKKSSKKKLSKKKLKKKNQKFIKKIYKNYINVANYLEIDRRLIDYKNYYEVNWVVSQDSFSDKEKYILANPLKKISLNLSRANNTLKINDIIDFKALILPISAPEFDYNFDLYRDAMFKKIDGYGFFIGTPTLFKNSSINANFADNFIQIRQIIREKFLRHLSSANSAIALALTIGDNQYISAPTLNAIRNTGLSHLLSISGFHLSLASGIFFVVLRVLMSRIQYISLRFDNKKIAAFFALFASYGYLMLVEAPLPAQRAFIVVWLVMLSYILARKFDGKRALFLGLLILFIINPFNLFQVSFLLSYLGALVMVSYVMDLRDNLLPEANLVLQRGLLLTYLSKIKLYFMEIFLLTTLIQISSLPILMSYFQKFSIVAFVANLCAIPLVAFVIMPLCFLAVFLMIFKLEFIVCYFLDLSLSIFGEIIYFFNDFKYAVIATPYLNTNALIICLLAVVIFYICHSKGLKILMLLIFVLGLFTPLFAVKPSQILIEKSQKFYALSHHQEMLFNKELKLTKQVKNWLKFSKNKQVKTIEKCSKTSANNRQEICQDCRKNFCIMHVADKSILFINRRTRINALCKMTANNNFMAIVNLTKIYELPSCIKNRAHQIIIIDNLDFIHKKTKIINI